MAKLQTNFSWQKYEGEPENQREQFQFQLQQQHILVANAVNTTIDDLSFWSLERPTTLSYVNAQNARQPGLQIYTKTLATVAWTAVGTINTIPLGITGNFTVINMVCCISDGSLSSSTTLLLPHIDTAVAANAVSIIRSGTNVVLTSGGTDRSAYSGYVTIYYIKS